ncbi:MAG: O-acetyl-ADP-ribose deacetylase [Elusimicrobia bacterium]|nr:O-acetyl-ADP-ribose deacetylase [Elusimicrobiota bacterium]
MAPAQIGRCRIELVEGDITLEATDAIVNAANSRLAGGGGVDGAIHAAGGPEIMRELAEKYDGCPTGSAVITGGGRLKAEFVIHAVGPRYSGSPKDAELLADAYRESLKLCTSHALRSVSVCAISTGIYGYPMDAAARVAVRAVVEFLRGGSTLELVRFVLFDSRAYASFESALRAEIAF